MVVAHGIIIFFPPLTLYLSLVGIGPWYCKKPYLEVNNIHGKYS